MTGNPLVSLFVDGSDGDSGWRGAEHLGIGANGFNLNGGGVHDSAGNAANLSHDVVLADPAEKVNSTTLT